MNKKRHALVIGGSLGGMLAARVLSDYFERVTVIERDRYPQDAAARKGVPQANHVHVLMKGGQIILEQLFGGLQKELVAAGAHILEMASETAWLNPAGWGVRFNSDLRMLALTRPLLDWHVRQRLAELPQVRFVDNTELVRLLPNSENDGVAGAVIRYRCDSKSAASEQHIYADLVVDVSGRGSCAPKWLAELGYEKPSETIVNAFHGYASRFYTMPSDFEADWKCAYIQAAPPQRTRGAVLFPVEGNRWLLSLVGGGRDYPPADEEGFLGFARDLADPIVYETIRELTPCSPIHSYRAAENRLRHFERLARFPENFLIMGDAACAFNPVYGQGMTILAIGALTLMEALDKQQSRFPEGSLRGLSRRFQKELAKVNSAPWLLATGEDFRFPQTDGGSPNLFTRLMHGYMDQIVCLTTRDKDVRQILLETFHMLRKPTSLFKPRIILKVLKLLLAPRQRVFAARQPATKSQSFAGVRN